MDAAQISATLLLLRQEGSTPGASEREQRVTDLAFNLIEHYLLEQKRQTELLEWIANIGQFFENQRREGMG